MALTIQAPAKLNLTLDILRRREDGYHDMRMVMQSISLWDEVTLEGNTSGVITCESNWGTLPNDERNLAVKAAKRFFEAVRTSCDGLHIRLEKKIPAGAGMAGGSSDAAAVLRGLKELYAPQMTSSALQEIGAMVGSDVPYCVRGGTALAEGRGEVLTDLPGMPECSVVVCKPRFSISTPMLFSRVRVEELKNRPDTAAMIGALKKQDVSAVASCVANVFEEVLPEEFSEVFCIKEKLLSFGALAAAMTGSGPTVFGLFSDVFKAREAYTALRETYAETFLEKTL